MAKQNHKYENNSQNNEMKGNVLKPKKIFREVINLKPQ